MTPEVPLPSVPLEEVETRFERDPPEPPGPEAPPPRPQPTVPQLDRPLPASAAAVRLMPPRVVSSAVAEDSAPSEIYNPPPDYPPPARRRGIEGEALAQITILPDGSCGDARLLEWSGSPAFGEAALEAVRRWRFRPAVRGGQAVAARQSIRFLGKERLRRVRRRSQARVPAGQEIQAGPGRPAPPHGRRPPLARHHLFQGVSRYGLGKRSAPRFRSGAESLLHPVSRRVGERSAGGLQGGHLPGTTAARGAF